MMTSKEIVLSSINYTDPGVIPLDIGGCTVTGMHCLAVEKLRRYYGLKDEPVKVIEPIQMLGEVDDELKAIMEVDVEGTISPKNKFGMYHDGEWKEFRTLWGQIVLVPANFNVITGEDGSHLVPPEGDLNAAPSAKMPAAGYYFDPIIRQQPIVEEALNVLAFGSPELVKKQVTENCRIFGKGGGFVFNTVHNIQATVPAENVVAMMDAFKECRNQA